MPYAADEVRWFDALGACPGWGKPCGKPAHGKLMGPRNESYGAYCTPCANKRLEKARKEREAEKKKDGGQLLRPMPAGTLPAEPHW